MHKRDAKLFEKLQLKLTKVRANIWCCSMLYYTALAGMIAALAPSRQLLEELSVTMFCLCLKCLASDDICRT